MDVLLGIARAPSLTFPWKAPPPPWNRLWPVLTSLSLNRQC